MTYDFFLPGLLIHAIENHNPEHLVKWAGEIIDKGIRTVNMLGCHDGIPLLDLKGLLPEEDIQTLIDTVYPTLDPLAKLRFRYIRGLK